LYDRLADLARIGSSYSWVVRINTNGSMIDETMARRLLDAGVNYIDISLYGSSAAVHDPMRGRRGSWQEATAAIEMLARLAPHYPGFRLMTQTILSRHNLLDFSELIRLHRRLGSAGMLVSYVEGDFGGQHLPEPGQIQEFREQVLSEMEEVARTTDLYVRGATCDVLTQLFSPRLLLDADWASGRYRPARGHCSVPSQQALVLANGDVHPCNMVEYAHEPVMGNLWHESLAAIWEGRRWRTFRRELHDKCELCPMGLHVYVPLQAGRGAVAMGRWVLQALGLSGLEPALYGFMRQQITRWRRLVGARAHPHGCRPPGTAESQSR